MRNAIIGLLVFSVIALGASAVFAQPKTITAKEYVEAREKADNATANSYPRTETYTFKHDDLRDEWSKAIYESDKRSYTEIIIKRGLNTETTERVEFDGSDFERINKGVWKKQGAIMEDIVPFRFAAVNVYTLEEFTQYGKSYKLYTETSTFPDGKKYVCWFRIDNVGRIVEYDDKEDGHRHMMIEYPDKIFPIKKPRLGSRDNVWYRSESPTRGSSPVPPVNTKPK